MDSCTFGCYKTWGAASYSICNLQGADSSLLELPYRCKSLGKKNLFFYFFIFWAKRRWNNKAECLKSSLSWAVHFFWIFSLKIPIRQWNCLLNLNNFNIFLKKYCNVYFIRSTKQSTLNKGCLFKISPIHLCHSFCILKCSWNFLSNIFHKCFWQWRQTLHLLSL